MGSLWTDYDLERNPQSALYYIKSNKVYIIEKRMWVRTREVFLITKFIKSWESGMWINVGLVIEMKTKTFEMVQTFSPGNKILLVAV